MSRIRQAFAALDGGKALIPYITVGDPDIRTTLALMHGMVANGADILELGVPFSDPMADGPVIQRAAERALANGISLRDVLDVVRKFRETDTQTPVVLMGYLNPVHKMGYREFAQEAAKAGVDGVLTVDSPVETIDPLYRELKDNGVDCIFLIAPTTTEDRIKTIAELAGGFVYYVSLKGVTGAASLDTDEVSRKIEYLHQYIDIPIGVGFGISNAESARKIGRVADAVIVGSRIVKEIENNAGNEAAVVGALVKELKDAVR
ncbi:tryptophan synthase subunit alpha [Neisseria meningitidis]|uniref:Tryptophan synthase alpha chain n=1 Tax=Neisseria meningitidis alpha153 TaxID=663926 RepID=C6SCT7_NEIME|nr:tryptophan synthase subunit alpha [Neisseria meningitidis]CBA06358.1 Tryptophan synthase alpha chain [Neisseria meningitidis alpha153]EJU74548.1 tryptophan synthase, alpha subunit [Neisseria meningitidis NM2657]EJU80700.1 tryptophan synthase, alpha subunit [Neisseria meningitidis NM3081]ELL29873.1 tryptophan synthase, alpha subunit [Neisseria meningitidis 77221]MBG8616903.1 tryptophan synthase subunit alpha [Neisseria meningitidis]